MPRAADQGGLDADSLLWNFISAEDPATAEPFLKRERLHRLELGNSLLVSCHSDGAMHSSFQVVPVEWTLSSDREAPELFGARVRWLARNVHG